MKAKLIFLFYLFYQPIVFAQTIEVRGRVVDVTNGKAVGVLGITVSIGDNDYDITDKEGNFKLNVPKSKENVKITLENSKHTLLSPYAGLVNLPPSGFVNIRVCAQENEYLQKKVSALNQTIKNLESKHNFNKYQLVKMQQELLDTILYFDRKIAHLEQSITNNNTEKEKLLAQIKTLNENLQSLQIELIKAKEEKYLHQQASFATISTELKTYLDALENLNLMLEEKRISNYFSNTSAFAALSDKINAYNAARKAILENQDIAVKSVAHYWENSELTEKCNATYDFALKNVHDKTVFPMNSTIIDYLKEYSAHPIYKSKAEKGVKKGANETRPKLLPLIEELRQKIDDLTNNLRHNN